MKKPFISIIIPFYNEEKFLKRAINSVVNQTYSPIQIILVDDGSRDKSTLYAKEFCKNNPNSKLIIIPKSGPGNARNIGIENVTGTYIAFLDADDYFHNNAIEILYKNVISNNSDLSIGQYVMLDKHENVLKKSNWNHNKTFDNETAISLVASEKLIPTSWAKLFKSTIAKECSFPNLSWKEDDVFFLAFLLNSKTVSVVNKTLLTVNCRPDSLTRQIISEKMINDISKSYNKQIEILKPLKNKFINQSLIGSEINTSLNLLILLKIDWKNIENQKKTWIYFCDNILVLAKKAKKHHLNFKKKILLHFLVSITILGWRYSFCMISVFKRHQINHLKKVKS